MKTLKERYEEKIILQLQKELGIKNKLAVPRLIKVVVNMGIGGVFREKKALESTVNDLTAITGQKPSVRAAKLSVAGFNIRRGMPVGLTVVLRGKRMYAFLEKFFSIVLPRLRDFKGLSLKSFDKNGNYTIGLREHTVFPEIDLGKSTGVRSLEISIVTNAGNVKKSKRLLELLGMPFEKEA
jgi:large subunit ribosomal protein L5